jgi:hypothetical protein
MKMSFEDQPGVTAPLGYWVRPRCTFEQPSVLGMRRWVVDPALYLNLTPFVYPLAMQDPLGITKDADEKLFNVYRAQEIKHGRGKCPIHGMTWHAPSLLPAFVLACRGSDSALVMVWIHSETCNSMSEGKH